VTRVVVEVMPKPEILDPQGQAIVRALPELGFDNVTSVRQGKRFEIEVADGGDPLDVARQAASAMLANPVIEDFTVHLAD
jgi:phosphoribosylformylglycinamidine synthase